MSENNSASLLACFLAILIASVAFVLNSRRYELGIPRVGLKPGVLGNTSKGHFHQNALNLVQEGYSRYKDSLYSLWTTEMDRVIVSQKFMKDFGPLSRSQLHLTATRRLAGPYTGMDIAEAGDLTFNVVAGSLSQNIGLLAQPAYEEVRFALNKKIDGLQSNNGEYTVPLHTTITELITSASSRVFLATATGYSMDVFLVSNELNRYHRFMYPVVAPFLASYRQVRKRFVLAKKLLAPLITVRRHAEAKAYPDVLQWLVQSAHGREKATDEIVKRMLFLNMAAISTSGSTATNVLLDLCSRPDDMAMLREEMLEAVEKHGGITLATLSSLKKTDSFIGESRRVNSLGLMTFSRELMVPFKLSNGVTLPAHTYISMTHQPMMNDPEFFPSPETFDALRFFKMRQKEGQEAKHQFAQLHPSIPNWGVGKFAYPGRFWASAQIKLVLMVLLMDYEVSFPEGQVERPENIMNGENYMVSRTQQLVLKKRE